MKRIFLSLIVLSALLANSVYSQTEVQRKIFSPTFLSIVEYRAWEKSIGDSTQKISQLSSPTAIKIPLARNFAVDVAGTYILSSVENSELTGLTDVRARAVAMLFGDTVMLNAGVNIPNGKSALDMEETAVSAILSDKALGFKYNRLGEGLDITAGGGLAQAFGPVSFGIGAGYIIKGEYEIAKDIKYKPGKQLNATGGFDLLFSPLLLRSDVTYTTYQSDKSNSKEVFKEGNRLSAEESIIITTETITLMLSGRYINHAKSEIIPQGFNVTTVKKLYGDQINANAIISLQLVKGFNLKFLGESIIIAKNEDKKNDAKVFGFGGGITIKSKKGSFFDVTGKYYIGNANNGDTDLKGLSAVTAIRLIF
jgi:hypothetical protein